MYFLSFRPTPSKIVFRLRVCSDDLEIGFLKIVKYQDIRNIWFSVLFSILSIRQSTILSRYAYIKFWCDSNTGHFWPDISCQIGCPLCTILVCWSFFSPRHTKFLLMCFIVAKPSEMVASMMTIVFLPELIYKMYTTGS